MSRARVGPWLASRSLPTHNACDASRHEFAGHPLRSRHHMIDQTLVSLLTRRASHDADRLAFVFLGDGERETARLSFGDLDRRARDLAAELRARGLAGARVLLLYPPGLDYIEAFFGCLYAGAIAVPAY